MKEYIMRARAIIENVGTTGCNCQTVQGSREARSRTRENGNTAGAGGVSGFESRRVHKLRRVAPVGQWVKFPGRAPSRGSTPRAALRR